MFNTMVVMYCGLFTIGVIGLGLIAFHHILKKKEREVTMDQIKNQVIPELEQMTYRMFDKTMNDLPEKCVEMTKKMLKVQQEFEDDL